MSTIIEVLPGTPTFLDTVLDDVNVLRGRHGMLPLREMPHGCPQSPRNCPVALALDATGVNAFSYRRGPQAFPMPARVAKFILDFDKGLYPELFAT